jgi:hypothetical protein
MLCARRWVCYYNRTGWARALCCWLAIRMIAACAAKFEFMSHLAKLEPAISQPACSRSLRNGAHSTQGPLHTVDNTGNGVCGTAKATQLYRALACLEAASMGCLKAPLVLWDVGGGACQCVNVHWCPSSHHPWDIVRDHDLPTGLLTLFLCVCCTASAAPRSRPAQCSAGQRIRARRTRPARGSVQTTSGGSLTASCAATSHRTSRTTRGAWQQLPERAPLS